MKMANATYVVTLATISKAGCLEYLQHKSQLHPGIPSHTSLASQHFDTQYICPASWLLTFKSAWSLFSCSRLRRYLHLSSVVRQLLNLQISNLNHAIPPNLYCNRIYTFPCPHSSFTSHYETFNFVRLVQFTYNFFYLRRDTAGYHDGISSKIGTCVKLSKTLTTSRPYLNLLGSIMCGTFYLILAIYFFPQNIALF